MKPETFAQPPSSVWLISDDGQPPSSAVPAPGGEAWRVDGVEVATHPRTDSLMVTVYCPKRTLSRIAMRWNFASALACDVLILGDHWERGYGDLQWRHLQPERLLPWYWAIHWPGGKTVAVGVETGNPAALVAWTVDDEGVTCWLDLRNGGMPVVPGDRIITAGVVVATASASGENSFATIRRLCKRMCPEPRLPAAPVCGNNNWYYAYGRNFDQHQVLRDAALLAELVGDHANRPYCVIDAGWSPGTVCPGGPWTAGTPDKFPDMPGLAASIRATGVRPGIWMRPTALMTVTEPSRLRAGPQNAPEKALDLTLPENLELIRQDVARVRGWGYDLIKHDFSTYDAFGKWGFEMGAEITEPGWHWADRSLTNAEIIRQLYRVLREAAGAAMLLGCNTIGHLGAGLFEVQRTGDDTSGRVWERTRKMGVNTLAFRMPQHGTFFAVDADCVAHTEKTPWDKDKQFLDLVARSGTALFVSVDPTKITAEVKQTMSLAMRLALSGGEANAEPLDWLTTTAPRKWRLGGQDTTYAWTENWGTWPMKT